MAYIHVWLNAEQALQACTNLKCLSDQLARCVKAMILEKKTSPFFRTLAPEGIDPKEIEKIKTSCIDEYLSTVEYADLVNRMNKAKSKPKFTPN